MSIAYDLSEPISVPNLISKTTAVVAMDLARLGLLDYLFYTHDYKSVTVERKEVHDLSNRVDDLELQLKKAVENADRVALIIEGVMDPIDNSTLLYKRTTNKKYFRQDRLVPRSIRYYQGFVISLWEGYGIPTFFTASIEGTAEMLVQLEKYALDPTHDLFHRYIKPKVSHQDPRIDRLVGIGFGPKRAEALITHFGSAGKVMELLLNDREKLTVVSGVGKKTVEEVYKGLL